MAPLSHWLPPQQLKQGFRRQRRLPVRQVLVSESAPGKQAHSNRRKWGWGGARGGGKKKVFGRGRDKGEPHAEAGPEVQPYCSCCYLVRC